MGDGWRGLLPKLWSGTSEQRVHMDSPDAPAVIGEALFHCTAPRLRRGDDLVLMCVGTDRSIGDALGPLIGTLVSAEEDRGFSVVGTVDSPVHAGNLSDTVEWVEANFRKPFIVAVDACLGRSESVGVITVANGSLRPGAGVNKNLPPVGHVHLTGVVNVGGFMEYFVLQNTRLSLVMRMARVAATGVLAGLTRALVERESACSVPDY